MTLTKIDKAPVIKKILLAQPYLVSVRWADGTRKRFGSFEEANAYIEKRSVNQQALQSEVPKGYYRALEIKKSYDVPDKIEEEEVTEFDVMLVSFEDGAKVPIIKIVRALTGSGLKESKELITNLPAKIRAAVSDEDAQNAKNLIEESGGKAEVRPAQ